jgi:hypothetical protein
MSSCNQYSPEKLHSHKSSKPFPTHTGISKCSVTNVFMYCSPWINCIWSGGQYRCTVLFLYMQSCRVTANSYTNLTNSSLLLNGYLESIVSGQGGPDIIALHSFLYLQSCRVTAFGISLCRVSLTNLPLLLHVWYKSHQFAAVAVPSNHLISTLFLHKSIFYSENL